VDGSGALERDGLSDDVDDGELRLDLGNDARAGGDGGILERS
jgi:hypothetical protein